VCRSHSLANCGLRALAEDDTHRRTMVRCLMYLEVILCHAVESLDATGLPVEILSLTHHALDRDR